MLIEITKNPQSKWVIECRDGQGHSLVDMSLLPDDLDPTDRMHTAALHLISYMRAYAVDHECQLADHDGEHFHGAALVRTSAGRYFLAPNMQTSDDHTDRNCAEKNALGQSKEGRIPGEKITDIWFTGALANFGKGIDISPGQEGRRPTPCCVCMGALHRDNPDMNVHLLPMIRPGKNIGLKEYKKSEESAPGPAEVLSLKLSDLYKPAPVIISDPEQKRVLARVSGFLNDAVDEKTESDRLAKTFGKVSSHISRADALPNINEIFMRKLRQLTRLPGNHLRYAEIAVVHSHADKKFYGATSFINGRTPATPPAVSKAVHAATNDRVKGDIDAVYYMRVDMHALKSLAGVKDFSVAEDIVLNLPDGSSLERLRKGSVHYKNAEGAEKADKGLPIHIMVPNIISDFDPAIHVRTVYMGDIVPLPFAGTKIIRASRPESEIYTRHLSGPPLSAPAPLQS